MQQASIRQNLNINTEARYRKLLCCPKFIFFKFAEVLRRNFTVWIKNCIWRSGTNSFSRLPLPTYIMQLIEVRLTICHF